MSHRSTVLGQLLRRVSILEFEIARASRLPQGNIVVADRLYQDFGWPESPDDQGICLVALLKRGVRYAIRERRSYALGCGATSDQTIVLPSKRAVKTAQFGCVGSAIETPRRTEIGRPPDTRAPATVAWAASEG